MTERRKGEKTRKTKGGKKEGATEGRKENEGDHLGHFLDAVSQLGQQFGHMRATLCYFDGTGATLGLLWAHIGVTLASLGFTLVHFGVTWALLWVDFGITLRLLWVTFELLGATLVI